MRFLQVNTIACTCWQLQRMAIRRQCLRPAATKWNSNIQNWGGFIGQWDNRQWSGPDPAHGKYGEMTGLTPGFIKRSDLAWYSSHHHDVTGKNVDYAYSYLFGYSIDLPPGARTLKLPVNGNIRILAISVADENPEVKPARPLYDVLPNRSLP